MTGLVLALVGSRRFAAPDGGERARALIRRAVAKVAAGGGSIVTGDASGVDSWAREAAEALGVPCMALSPVNRRWAPDGFAARNQRVVDACEALMAIRCPEATTYGSGWTADRAVEALLPVSVWLLTANGTEVHRWRDGQPTTRGVVLSTTTTE